MTVPQETNSALNIQVIPQSDTISLELDDRIILRFTPTSPLVTPEVYFAGTGEFLRDATVVHILDDDSECCVPHIMAHISSMLLFSVTTMFYIFRSDNQIFFNGL